MDSRARILTALEAAGVRQATTGRLAAPVVHVEPGDPWSSPARMPGRVYRWRLTAIAGKADSEAAFSELGELLERVDAALRTIDGAQLPTWAKPTDYQLGNVPYAGTVGTIEITS